MQLLSSRSLLCPTCPATFFSGIHFSDALAQHCGAGRTQRIGEWLMENPLGRCQLPSEERPGLGRACAATTVTCQFFPCSPAWLGWSCFSGKISLPPPFPPPALSGQRRNSESREKNSSRVGLPNCCLPAGTELGWPLGCPSGVGRGKVREMGGDVGLFPLLMAPVFGEGQCRES